MSISYGAGITGGGGSTPATGLTFKGNWNALTNTPTLVSGVGTENDYYIVNVGGNTNLNGTSVWTANDWAIFSGGAWRRLGGGLATGVDTRDILTVTVNGQTVFTLSTIPENVNISQLMINGCKQTYGTDYTIVGTTVTWLNTNFTLATTDRVEIYY